VNKKRFLIDTVNNSIRFKRLQKLVTHFPKVFYSLVEREAIFKYYEIIDHDRSNYQYDNFVYARLALAEILGFFCSFYCVPLEL